MAISLPEVLIIGAAILVTIGMVVGVVLLVMSLARRREDSGRPGR